MEQNELICNRCLHKEVCYLRRSNMFELYIADNVCDNYNNIIKEIEDLIEKWTPANPSAATIAIKDMMSEIEITEGEGDMVEPRVSSVDINKAYTTKTCCTDKLINESTHKINPNVKDYVHKIDNFQDNIERFKKN